MIVLNEQSFRNFRHFYRNLSNGFPTRKTSIAGAALYFLCTTNPEHTYVDEDWQLGQAYLVNGPRCAGDTLILAGGESLQIEVVNTEAPTTSARGPRLACNNRMISGV